MCYSPSGKQVSPDARTWQAGYMKAYTPYAAKGFAASGFKNRSLKSMADAVSGSRDTGEPSTNNCNFGAAELGPGRRRMRCEQLVQRKLDELVQK